MIQQVKQAGTARIATIEVSSDTIKIVKGLHGAVQIVRHRLPLPSEVFHQFLRLLLQLLLQLPPLALPA